MHFESEVESGSAFPRITSAVADNDFYCINHVLLIDALPDQTGDLNCDGATNNFDIDPFVLALTDPAGYAEQFPTCNLSNADVNGDGAADNFDIDPFVALLTH